MKVVCAILAAGRSERMGAQKLRLPLGGTTLLERALAAAEGFRAIVVVSPALLPDVAALPDVVLNAAPERGMTHSLRLAHEAAGEPDAALAVLLADMPLVDAPLLRAVVAELEGSGADVAYPVRGGRRGHPVVFGPSARAALAGLREGDTLRGLRDDPRWKRAELAWSGDEPFADVDTPSALARLAAMLEPGAASAKS